MAFYQSIVAYYDRIFPLNDVAFQFIKKHFEQGDNVLDIGAGTGNLAIALAGSGLHVTASEPDLAMMEKIKEKSSDLDVSVHSKSMEQLTEFASTFDGIVCVGNTLPHLQSKESIEQFLSDCYAKLNEDGKLLLQLVNYDKVLSTDDFSFPVIEKDDFTFTRKYEVTDRKVMFTSCLTAKGETVENTIPLTPITSTELTSLLEKAGFGQIELFGNFKGEPYSKQSGALVCVAGK